MIKTSRRRFGKQITGALAALPIASLATTPDASAQTKDQAKTESIQARILTSHDTPPPVVIGDGSLIIESQDQFW